MHQFARTLSEPHRSRHTCFGCGGGESTCVRLRGITWLLPVVMCVAALATPQSSHAQSNSTASQGPDVIHPAYYPRSPYGQQILPGESDEYDKYMNRFLHLHSSSRYSCALEVVEQMLSLFPRNAAVHYNHACVLSRLMRVELAIEALERAIELGWRNLDHMLVDPDLQAVRWHHKFKAIERRLAAKIRHESREAVPLRDDDWQAIVEEIKVVVPNLMIRRQVSVMAISLVNGGQQVWTGTFVATPLDEHEHHGWTVRQGDANHRFAVDGPVQLLTVLSVLDESKHDEIPGVVRLVELLRHSATRTARDNRVRPAAGQSHQQGGRARTGVAPRRSGEPSSGSRRLFDDRVLRVHSVPNDIFPLLRLAAEHVHDEVFSNYLINRAFPKIGIHDSRLISPCANNHDRLRLGEDDVKGSHRHDQVDRHPSLGRAAPPLLDTSADELAAIIKHVLGMERSPNRQTMNWHQIVDHVLRSCVTRDMSIGSNITLRRTSFGLLTDVTSAGAGSGGLMRWYAQSDKGVVVLFEDVDGSGLDVAHTVAHLALGGEW